MTNPARLSIPIAALALVAGLNGGCARAMAQSGPKASGTASPEKPEVLELTVYTGDFGMVRETRAVELKEGRTRIGLQGVSKRLDQDSVVFGWPGTKDARVVSSTYDLGVADTGRLLQRFLGREIELVYRGEDGKPGERIKGILQVAEPGNVVVLAEGKYIVNPNATIEAPADGGIVTIPQLSAEVESGKAGRTDLAVTYMTNGLSWNADYTATLAPDADTLNLECWATVRNSTGTDYPDAAIRFVAGSPNRAVREERARMQPQTLNAPMASAGEFQARDKVEFESKPMAMGELYAYPYKSTATIRQDQTNRVRMMGSESVQVKRVYTIAVPALYREWGTLDPNHRLTATMGINLQNAKGSGLGEPLPAGAVRVYEPDKDGAARYVGAASIGDTPKDARVSLELTNVFDLYANARQTAARRIDRHTSTRSVEVTLHNEKARAVEIRLVQEFGGRWRIDSESTKSARLSAGRNEWRVQVPAGGETKFRYTVRLTD